MILSSLPFMWQFDPEMPYIYAYFFLTMSVSFNVEFPLSKEKR